MTGTLSIWSMIRSEAPANVNLAARLSVGAHGVPPPAPRTRQTPETGETPVLRLCIVCGAREMSSPESAWRAIHLGDRVVYACPRELPGPLGGPTDKADIEAFKHAYHTIFAKRL